MFELHYDPVDNILKICISGGQINTSHTLSFDEGIGCKKALNGELQEIEIANPTLLVPNYGSISLLYLFTMCATCHPEEIQHL